MTSPSGGCSACAIAAAASATATTSKPSSPSPRDSTKRSSGSSSTTSSRNTVTWTQVWPARPDSHLNGHRSGVVQGHRASLAPMTTTAAQTRDRATLGRKMLNKVPEVTIFFWVIKIMCTTVGETAADYLNDNLGFGLTKTTYVTGALLVVLLVVQFRLRRYVPGVYWSVVVVISVFGTLITDNLTDRYNVPLTTSTIVFAIILAAVFARLVRRRAHAVDPHDLHHPPRGLLLAGDPLHLRAGHRRRRPRRPRSSTSATPSRSLIFGGAHRRSSPSPTTRSGSTRSSPSGWPTS